MLQHSQRNEQALLLPHILDKKPNTYIFTKSIAEDLVRESSEHLPMVVVRPSIVTPTLNEPFPYYSNDQNAIINLMAGTGIGLIRVTSFNQAVKLDFTTGDMTVNCILAAGWYKVVSPESAHIYNCVGYENPVLLRSFIEENIRFHTESKEIVDTVLWVPHNITVENTFCLFVLYYLLHILPGMFFSMAERYLNRKPMIMKIYRKLFFLSKTLRYFVFNDWSFTNEHTKSLLFQLNAKDRELFDFNMASIHWSNYYSVLYRCVAIYTLKADKNKENRYMKELYKRKMKYIEPVDKAIIWTFRFAAVFLGYKILHATLSVLLSYLIHC
ncbi:hypothetical protein WDU94_010052 [Cyamophila willieti]